MVFFPRLELKYIENDDFVCGFLDDEKQKPVKINGQTTMIRPHRIAIALETDPKGLQDLLLQDQVSISSLSVTVSKHNSSPWTFCQGLFYIPLRLEEQLEKYGQSMKIKEIFS